MTSVKRRLRINRTSKQESLNDEDLKKFYERKYQTLLEIVEEQNETINKLSQAVEKVVKTNSSVALGVAAVKHSPVSLGYKGLSERLNDLIGAISSSKGKAIEASAHIGMDLVTGGYILLDGELVVYGGMTDRGFRTEDDDNPGFTSEVMSLAVRGTKAVIGSKVYISMGSEQGIPILAPEKDLNPTNEAENEDSLIEAVCADS